MLTTYCALIESFGFIHKRATSEPAGLTRAVLCARQVRQESLANYETNYYFNRRRYESG